MIPVLMIVRFPGEGFLEGADTACGELDTIGGIRRHTIRGRHDMFFAIGTVTNGRVVIRTETETRISNNKSNSPNTLNRNIVILIKLSSQPVQQMIKILLKSK